MKYWRCRILTHLKESRKLRHWYINKVKHDNHKNNGLARVTEHRQYLQAHFETKDQ